jgi:trans-aconitate methyltransferase
MRLRKLLKYMSRYDFSQGRYADFGCGDGFVTSRVMAVTRATTCDAMDADTKLLEEGSKKFPGIRFFWADLNRNGSEHKKYDFVTCFETLEHVMDLPAAIRNLLAFTKPGGLLIISVPIEVGLIGTAKFLAKTIVWRDRLTEAFEEKPGLHREYFKALVFDRGIYRFRENGNGLGYWPGHWGFDYRKVEEYLQTTGACFKLWRLQTTCFFEVRNGIAGSV